MRVAFVWFGSAVELRSSTVPQDQLYLAIKEKTQPSRSQSPLLISHNSTTVVTEHRAAVVLARKWHTLLLLLEI